MGRRRNIKTTFSHKYDEPERVPNDAIIREAVESIFEQKTYADPDGKRKAVDACLIRLQMTNKESNETDQIVKAEEAIDLLVQDDADDGLLGGWEEVVRRVQVAMDSGACRHVINPEDLPPGPVPAGNPIGKVSHGANNSTDQTLWRGRHRHAQHVDHPGPRGRPVGSC